MKYALVTGGSRGIGRAVCIELAAQGIPVIINYIFNTEAAMETKQLIEEKGGKAELLPFDVADSASVDRAMETWSEAHPDDFIGILINNAGIRQDVKIGRAHV